MKRLPISLIMTLSLITIFGCDNATTNVKQEAKIVAEKYVYEGKSAANELMEIYEDQLTSDEMEALEKARNQEVELLMEKIKSDAYAFASKVVMSEDEDIAQLRQQIAAYTETLSEESALRFKEFFSEALNEVMEKKKKEL